MGYECFELSDSDGVAHLQLARPDELNSMNTAFWRELPDAVRSIDADGRCRVLVVSSTGRHFTAGMDLEVFLGGGFLADPDEEKTRGNARTRGTALHLQESFTVFEKARMPVIAAVQGGCIGAGLDLITACDLRYGSADAFFSVQETNIGMTADVGTLQRLPRVVPEGVAKEMAYLGRRLPADRAYEVGLLNGLYDTHDELVAGALEIAAEVASKSPMAVWGCKQVINYSRDHTVADGLDYIATWQSGMFSTDDMAEAFGAKAEGREPEFPDLGPRRLDLG
jgi:enoyl-CoA hydratase